MEVESRFLKEILISDYNYYRRFHHMSDDSAMIMSVLDRSLQKLLAAASRARAESPGSPPFALEAAVIAHCRRPAQADEQDWLVWLYRRAVIFALVVMTLSCASNYFENWSNAGTTALARYAMMQLPP